MMNAKLKKVFCASVMLALAVAMLAGCSDRTEEKTAQAAPTPNYMPQGSAVQNGNAARPLANRFDWTRDAAQIENRINQISEIEEARVVVTGDTALVGVRFDRAYRGDMTERIREMVAAEVMAADPQITTVAVTADDDDVEDVYELSNRTAAGKDLDTLKDDINEIVRNATTLR